MNNPLLNCQQRHCSPSLRTTQKEGEKTKKKIQQIVENMKKVLGKLQLEKDEKVIASHRQKLDKYKNELQKEGSKGLESKAFKKITHCSIKKCNTEYNESLASISQVLQQLCEANKTQACEMVKQIKEINKKIEKKNANEQVIQDISEIMKKLSTISK